MRRSPFLALSLVLGCSDPVVVPDAGTDAPAIDAGTDAPSIDAPPTDDAGLDAAEADAGESDAAVELDAALPIDALPGFDSGLASCVPGAWRFATVASEGEVGIETAIAVDGSTVHIAYRAETAEDLGYAEGPPLGPFTTEIVDATGDVGRFPGIAVDGAGTVWIEYRDATSFELWVARRPVGGTFSTAMVAPGGEHGAIAIDSTDGIHVAYYTGSGNQLMHAFLLAGGTSWTTSVVDTTSFDIGRDGDLAIDDADGLHFSYWDVTDDDLEYAYGASSGTTYTRTTLVSTGSAGRATSIAVDGFAGVHVSYVAAGDLWYAYRASGGSFELTPIDTGTPGLGQTSLAIDRFGGIHVVFYDSMLGALRHAEKPPLGPWTVETVDDVGDVGLDPSLATDSAGALHVAYHDRTNGDLRYAYRCP